MTPVSLVKPLIAVLRDSEGATMVEYSIMVAFIAAVAFGAVKTLGQDVLGLFSSVVNAL